MKDWNVCDCNSEADICIGATCKRNDVVITCDSDSLIYGNINTVWRPFGRSRYLIYNVPQLLLHLELSRVGLTALGVVSQNDYGKGVYNTGVKTNLKVIRALENGSSTKSKSVKDLIHAYLEHTTISSKHPTKDLFDSALRIFSFQQYTPSIESHIQDPVDELREITQRLSAVRLQLKRKRKMSRYDAHCEKCFWPYVLLINEYINIFVTDPYHSRSASSDQARKGERGNIFIRYSTVDRAPDRLPPPHSSGRPYKYRERYSIKTRSRLIQHEQPDIFKQYTWRAPRENSKSTISSNNVTSAVTNTEASSSTSTCFDATNPPPKMKPKSVRKKDQLTPDQMTKIQLIRAMQWEHPLRTLDVGTLKANSSRALDKEILNDVNLHDKLQLVITTCLSDVSYLASKKKRACQQAIGQYLENLSVAYLDRDDKIILSYLTSSFSDKEIKTTIIPAFVSKPDFFEDNPEEGGNEKNPPYGFFLSVLVAIYKASAKESKSTGAAAAAYIFICKAKDYLPSKIGIGKFAFCVCRVDLL
ncbi:hypothetical protein FBU30_007995 [Linnemannia zychae]|nr:hypothetical protein FBU30_007995 [Linnemannia zychae]